MSHAGATRVSNNETLTLCCAVALGVGLLFGYWTADGELRSLRAQNHELAIGARKLADAAYVCMDHCGATTCQRSK